MKLENNIRVVRKFSSWAGSLSGDIDFIDYWYNLYLSKTKTRIDSNPADNINAHYWTRWQEDFEEFVDGYIPRQGEGFIEADREWFASYMQYLIYAIQMSSKDIANYYGKEVFTQVISSAPAYHTFGVDLFIEHFVDRFGLPSGIEVMPLNM